MNCIVQNISVWLKQSGSPKCIPKKTAWDGIDFPLTERAANSARKKGYKVNVIYLTKHPSTRSRDQVIAEWSAATRFWCLLSVFS